MVKKIKYLTKYNNFLKSQKIGIFIIAKLGSRRLKNKIKARIYNFTLIEILIKRLINEIGNQNIIICSSGIASKKFFAPYKNKYKVRLFFGHNKNVLARILKCMKLYNLSHIVRVTGDNPLTDCKTIKNLIALHIKNKNDYTYTNSMPIGMRSEIFSFNALQKYYHQILDKNSTEYLSYFFLRRDLYKIENLRIKKFFKNQNRFNISIDYENDLLFLKKMFKHFKNNIYINTKKIINYLNRNSRLVKIITKIPLQTNIYNARYSFDKKKKFIL